MATTINQVGTPTHLFLDLLRSHTAAFGKCATQGCTEVERGKAVGPGQISALNMK